MMKKIFGFILSAAMMLSVVSTTVMAADGVTFTAGNVTVNKDEATTVTVNIDLSNNPGLTAVNFKVGYDAEAFEYKAAKKSEYKLGDDYGDNYDITLSKPNKALNPFIISAYSADPWYDDATFVSLVFYLKDGVKNGTYPITLTAGDNSTTDENVKPIAVNYVSGSITVTGTEEDPKPVVAELEKGGEMYGMNTQVAKVTTNGAEVSKAIVTLDGKSQSYDLPAGVSGTADFIAIIRYAKSLGDKPAFTLSVE